MISALKVFFTLVLAVMTWVTVRASLDRGVIEALHALTPDLWFQATLCDTYFAFLTIWLWMAYKEKTWAVRLAWFAAVMILGNFAIAAYCLIQLFRLKPGDPVENILRRNF